MKRSLIKISTLVLAMASFSPGTMGAETPGVYAKKYYVGLSPGMALPSLRELSNRFDLGASAGLRATGVFGGGAYVHLSEITFFGLEAAFFGDEYPGFSAGLRGGGALRAQEVNFSMGPKIGWEWIFENGLSVGGEADVLFVLAPQSVNSVHFNVSIKYWFQ